MSFNLPLATFLVNLILALATIFAVFVALFGKKYWTEKDKPLIKVGFGNYEPYLVLLNSDTIRLHQITLLFRLKIVNQGETVAKNCRVKLLSVKSEEGNNVLDKNEPDVLKWSSSPRDMRFRENPSDIRYEKERMNITNLVPIFREKEDITPRKGWEFCDLFEINGNRQIVFVSHGRRKFFAEKDKSYIATIEISGDNTEPTKKEILFSVPDKVDWTNPSNPKINLAQIDKVKNIFQ